MVALIGILAAAAIVLVLGDSQLWPILVIPLIATFITDHIERRSSAIQTDVMNQALLTLPQFLIYASLIVLALLATTAGLASLGSVPPISLPLWVSVGFSIGLAIRRLSPGPLGGVAEIGVTVAGALIGGVLVSANIGGVFGLALGLGGAILGSIAAILALRLRPLHLEQ